MSVTRSAEGGIILSDAEIRKSNSYTRQQCTKCQHIFAIDSGD